MSRVLRDMIEYVFFVLAIGFTIWVILDTLR